MLGLPHLSFKLSRPWRTAPGAQGAWADGGCRRLVEIVL